MYEKVETMGEPVARVLDIDGPKLMYKRKFHNGKVGTYQAYEGMHLHINDHLLTDKNTLALVQFAIGGEVGMGKETEIVILGHRKAATVGNQFFNKAGQMWQKIDKQKQQLQIQTGGGALGGEG